jgi:mercuric ion transport protein
MGLGLIGAVAAALCCIAIPLALSAGGAGLAALAAWLDYAWIAVPILLAGLVAYLLWRRTAQWTGRTEGHHR